MYNNCIEAVKKYQTDNTNSNISKNPNEVTCKTGVTKCILVGNSEPLHVCFKTGPTLPQRVYENHRAKSLHVVADEKSLSHDA